MKVVLTLALGALLLSGCKTGRGICHTPTKREIRKAMSHSDWRYSTAQPEMGQHTQSIFNRAEVEVGRH